MVKGKWSTSIILDGTHGGELVIKVKDIDPEIEENIDEDWLHRRKADFDIISARAKEGMKQLSMTYLLNEMRNVFSDAWEFVLPGAGDFCIHKAVFNREEDLLCEIKYKFHP